MKPVEVFLLVTLCLGVGVVFLSSTESEFINLQSFQFSTSNPTKISSELPEITNLTDLQAEIVKLEKENTNLRNAVKDKINMTNFLTIYKSFDPCDIDPLDDSCTKNYEGQPKLPLTIEKANMCDEKTNAKVGKQTELVCKTDPTCKKCRAHSIEKTEALEKGFLATKVSASRRVRLRTKLPSKNIIVSSVNEGQLYLFLNWACSCIKNNVFDPRKYMYIVPTDKKTYEIVTGFGFIAEPLDWYEIAHREGLKISSTYNNKANVGSHATINNILAFACNFIIQQGKNVLLMDVDLIFLRDPFPWLEKASLRRDLLGMYSPREDMYGYVNSGFVYFKNTIKSKYFLQSLQNLCYIKETSDQQLFNSILRHPKMQQIEQRILPRWLFFTLWKSTTKYGFDENKTFVVHAVSNNKAQRFIKMKQWHLDESCPFYNNDIFQQAKTKGLLD
eukprot:snap_masked-scaffold_10-processed-gene-8.39-mRNA-1 protein AED:1.00 eAED:1.00 QI:0/-1/0/0/-1/1/1/0/445